MDKTKDEALTNVASSACPDGPAVLEEIEVEDLAVDGICGVY
jgi:mycofactocin precursor